MRKRIFASATAAVLTAALLSACGQKTSNASVVLQSAPISSSSTAPTAAMSSSSAISTTVSSTWSPAIVVSSSTMPSSSTESKPPEASTFEPVIIVPDPVSAYTYTSALDNYREKWGYNHINSKQRKVYEKLYAAAEKYDTSEIVVSDLGIVTDDIYKAYWAFDHDNPQFLELGSGYQMKLSGADKRTVMGVSILFGRSPSKISHSEFDSVAKDVVSQAADKPTDYDKLLFIHDWLVDNTVYTAKNKYYEYEADGPVVHGKAVCEGYSKAFMYFAQSVGIDCVCVIGKANDEQHMWNLVNLYGCWYHVDVTWDDPVRSDGSNVLRHNYFLLSDRDIGETHKIEEIFPLPAAPNTYAQ